MLTSAVWCQWCAAHSQAGRAPSVCSSLSQHCRLSTVSCSTQRHHQQRSKSCNSTLFDRSLQPLSSFHGQHINESSESDCSQIQPCFTLQERISLYWHCWLDDRKGIQPVKSWLLVCWWWHSDWSFARLIAPVVTTTSITLSSNKTG